MGVELCWLWCLITREEFCLEFQGGWQKPSRSVKASPPFHTQWGSPARGGGTEAGLQQAMFPGTLMPCYKDTCMQAALSPPEAMNVPLTGAETSRLVAHPRQSGHTLSLDVNPYPPCNHRQERCQGCPFCALSTWGQRAAREAPSHSRLCLPTSCSLCLECLLPPRPTPTHLLSDSS